MTVMGVDPGINGAMAVYDYNSGLVVVTDMPTWNMQIASKVRKRVDAVDLLDYFEMQKMAGVELVMIEAVGGRPKQSASAGFVFGYTVGMIYMACVAVRMPIETVPPQTWKKLMRVPGKKDFKMAGGKTDKAWQIALVSRADECFPHNTSTWRGPQGGYKIDRAEAALLAMYAGRYALNSTKVVHLKDIEWKLAYMKADTGS